MRGCARQYLTGDLRCCGTGFVSQDEHAHAKRPEPSKVYPKIDVGLRNIFSKYDPAPFPCGIKNTLLDRFYVAHCFPHVIDR
jgi:hypothetical protein